MLVLLLIELLDELVYGAREAAWPLIRTDLGLSYGQIGLLLGAPSVFGSLVEPAIYVLGDVWRRRVLVVGGGLALAGALVLVSLSHGFGLLLLALLLLSPASGAFVGLAQASLMDLDPARHEQNMARWTFAGSVGAVAGPLALGMATALALGWQAMFAGFAALTLLLVVAASRLPFAGGTVGSASAALSATSSLWHGLRAGLVAALQALRRREVLRWLVLLEFSDLMLDVLLGFLALYLVDVGAMTPAQAGAGVAIWTGLGLLGDLALIPLLERVDGLRYLRFSALAELLLFSAFLLVPAIWARYVLVGLLGFFNAGWYAILKARLFSSMPGQSGTALAVNNVSSLVGGLIPLALGLLAQRLGLGVAMGLLLLGPAALLVGLPRARR